MQRRDRVKRERKEASKKHLTHGLTAYQPNEDPNVKGDPFKTLFVARLDYNVDYRDLEREFGRYGSIQKVFPITIQRRDSGLTWDCRFPLLRTVKLQRMHH